MSVQEAFDKLMDEARVLVRREADVSKVEEEQGIESQNLRTKLAQVARDKEAVLIAQEDIKKEKGYVAKLLSQHELEKQKMDRREALIKEAKELLDIREEKLKKLKIEADTAILKASDLTELKEALEHQKAILEREKAIDLERKKMLDLRENRIKVREGQLQMESTI